MIKLHLDELTKKVLGYTNYPIDTELDDYITEDNYLLEDRPKLSQLLSTNDVYFIDEKIVVKDKDPEEYHNQLQALQDEIGVLKTNLDTSNLLYTILDSDDSISDMKEKYASTNSQISLLEQAQEQLVNKHLQDTKNYFYQQNKTLDASKHKYYSSICLLIKDENEYLIEWITWHLNIGIEHLYIYDNDSQTPVSETIKELPKEMQNKITVIDWSGTHEHMQHDCYYHCLKTYGEDSTWIAFLDSDEFIRLTGDNPSDINTFLHDYEEYGALYMCWIMYNANGQKQKENLPVKERFTKIVTDHKELGFGKLFVKPTRVKKMLVHMAILKVGSETVNENFETQIGTFQRNISYDKIAVDHYYTKSYEEWCSKMLRGSCDPKYHRKYDEFFKYNQDMMSLYDEKFLKEQGYDA